MNKITMNTITFPIFKLGDKPINEGGISFFIYGKDTKYSDAEYKISVVDDANLKETSLALRRLKLKEDGVNLHPLNKAIFFISDLIKLAKPGVFFIDKEGQIFEYTKTTRVPLVYKPILKTIPLTNGGAIIEVKGVSNRFKTLFPPRLEDTHAGLLVVGTSYILYGLYDQAYDPTNREI